MSDAEEQSPVRAPLPTTTFITAVSQVRAIGHPFVRITFAGGDLEQFRPVGADQFLYLLLPPTGRDELTIDSDFTWERYRTMPEAERPVGAYYTVREYRPEGAEIDIDVMLHEPAGVASSWAAEAKPGMPVALWGPRTAYRPPAEANRQLLLGDETGLPAIAAILEEGGPPAQVIVEVDQRAVLELPETDGLEVTRIDRSPGEPGGDPRLLEAVRALSDLSDAYVWGGGEFDSMGAIRRHVREERGLPATQVSLVGYWRASAPL